MGQVLIRNVSDQAIEAFKIKAQIEGTSLEQVLRTLIEKNAPFTAEECLRISQQFVAQSGGPYEPLSREDLREGLL